MAVTFGFYNSKNGDRVYNAQQLSSIFSGIIRDGVFEHYPTQNQHLHVDWLDGQVGNKVVIGPGRAWLNNTWTDNDSNLIIELDAPNPDQNIERVDAIVLEINTTNDSDSASNMSETVPGRSNRFVVIKGIEASPADVQKPSLRNGNGIYQYYIALVRISSNQEHHYITNMVGTVDGPSYIVGAVQNVSTADILQAWTQAFHAAINNLIAGVPDRLNAACAEYFSDPNSAIYHQIDDLEELVTNHIDSTDPVLGYLRDRRHVWIIDKDVSSISGDVVTYSKQPPAGDSSVPYDPVATPAHNIYPDFYNTIRLRNVRPQLNWIGTVQITSPNVGDVVIGSNGYYAIITSWTLSGDETRLASYTMTIQSTGMSIAQYVSGEYEINFSGGYDMDGHDESSAYPVNCNRIFSEILNADSAGKKLVTKMLRFEQGQGSPDETWFLGGTIERYYSNNVLTKVVARFISEDTQETRCGVHVYTITNSGIENRHYWIG